MRILHAEQTFKHHGLAFNICNEDFKLTVYVKFLLMTLLLIRQ